MCFKSLFLLQWEQNPPELESNEKGLGFWDLSVDKDLSKSVRAFFMV